MEIEIDIESATPIFAQLVEQIKNGVAVGLVKSGDQLPSIRQLSNDLDVNSKTVAKAYKILERDSIIQSKGYRGTFIEEGAIEHCQFNLHRWLVDKLEDAIKILKNSGATDSEIRIAFNQVINQTQD